jgi:hypothetical protein
VLNGKELACVSSTRSILGSAAPARIGTRPLVSLATISTTRIRSSKLRRMNSAGTPVGVQAAYAFFNQPGDIAAEFALSDAPVRFERDEVGHRRCRQFSCGIADQIDGASQNRHTLVSARGPGSQRMARGLDLAAWRLKKLIDW